MCDCAEELKRQAAEREERRRARARSSSSTGGVAACYAEPRSGCGFFTCGLWGGGAAGAGSWLPYAGSAMLLALMVYMLRNVRKHVCNLCGTSKTIGSRGKKCNYPK